MATVHRTDEPDDDRAGDDLGGATDPMVGDNTPEPSRLIAVIRAAIDDARNGGVNMYGPDGYIGDRRRRGFAD